MTTLRRLQVLLNASKGRSDQNCARFFPRRVILFKLLPHTFSLKIHFWLHRRTSQTMIVNTGWGSWSWRGVVLFQLLILSPCIFVNCVLQHCKHSLVKYFCPRFASLENLPVCHDDILKRNHSCFAHFWPLTRPQIIDAFKKQIPNLVKINLALSSNGQQINLIDIWPFWNLFCCIIGYILEHSNSLQVVIDVTPNFACIHVNRIENRHEISLTESVDVVWHDQFETAESASHNLFAFILETLANCHNDDAPPFVLYLRTTRLDYLLKAFQNTCLILQVVAFKLLGQRYEHRILPHRVGPAFVVTATHRRPVRTLTLVRLAGWIGILFGHHIPLVGYRINRNCLFTLFCATFRGETLFVGENCEHNRLQSFDGELSDGEHLTIGQNVKVCHNNLPNWLNARNIYQGCLN